MTISLTTLSLTTLGMTIKVVGYSANQHTAFSFIVPSVAFFITMLSVIRLDATMPSVIMPNAVVVIVVASEK
jgi:hypothetical protein